MPSGRRWAPGCEAWLGRSPGSPHPRGGVGLHASTWVPQGQGFAWPQTGGTQLHLSPALQGEWSRLWHRYPDLELTKRALAVR